MNIFVSFDMPKPDSFDMADADSNPFSQNPGFDMAQLTGPLSHLQKDIAIFLAVEFAYLFIIFAIFFISAVSVILVSSFSYRAENLSIKDLFSLMRKTWLRALITTFYVSALWVGFVFTISILVAPLVFYRNNWTLLVTVLVWIMASALCLYVSVTWALAIVVSVVEESVYGLRALGKAAGIVGGKKLHGFVINVCYNLVIFIVYRVYKLVLEKQSMACGLLLVSFIVLMKMLVGVAYTVLYFECREQHHGEDVIEYSKVQNVELVNDMA
ncbi:Unknown protein [Striga hermonthica]|uniref:Transmembrane protein n=1 Tax=Striga hermonthica TaxID=68872 RepID=A0A9N7MVA9_STRHE|nr:Unknown protein [Striga hermonthica]